MKGGGRKTRGRPPAAPRRSTAKADASAGGAGRTDRPKRLLDLVMMLLRARAPVTFREIREHFRAYKTANVEAGLRAFERDKADLLDLGVPIRYLTPDEDDALEEGGYVVDLKVLRLPEVHLTADEVSALVLAASMARAVPGGSYGEIVDLALQKLAFDLPEAPDTPLAFPAPARREPVLVHFPATQSKRARELSERFATLEAATRQRKRIHMRYRSAAQGLVQDRDVDPYGLVYREGSWVLVGWCHLRKDVRSFRLDRILELSVAPRPKSPDFERPPGFDARRFAARSPWTFTAAPTEEVELEIRPEAAGTANEDFGPDAVRTPAADGAVCIRFACGNPDFAVSRVLAAKGAILVRRGARLRQRIAEELAAVAEMYRS